ncbi:MAG: hypothetical protein A3F11_04795 [Gammaproteobacteria bacterium RIFCSPHIGHO2_12_FULL_37_14]|nr:MAG: hypothetical protein A3F11_04795 [Gammaproteobacteria bacterium RIFCSPHIGHO2_12_FULL_37_14]
MTNDTDPQKKLLELVRTALKMDSDLREKYNIGNKFCFIRERLQNILTEVETKLTSLEQTHLQTTHEIMADDTLVYVHIYNAQGNVLKTWLKMLNPAVFYEYSVNRPIYSEKSHIEALIRSKPNKLQHGYLTIVVKTHDLIKIPELEISKDAIGNILIKVKEGCLHFDKLISLTHNEQDYQLNATGELVKK